MAGRDVRRAGRPGKRAAGILSDPGLCGALESDLAARGVDLWGRPLWFVGRAADALLADPTSMVARAAGGDGHTRADHLLYMILDQLRLLVWLQTKDGARGINRPSPSSPLAERPHRIGHTDRDPEEVLALLARLGPQPDPEVPSDECS